MSQLVHKDAREEADGVRTTFTVPEPFVDGTLRLCINGRSYVDDWAVSGWLTVELEEAPYEGDMVSFWYQQV